MKINKILKIFIAIVLLISLETSVIAASTGTVNVDTVRVRKKATTDSGIVVLVSIGDEVTILGEEGNWYKVKVNGDEGYIRKDLLTVDGEITTVTPTEQPAENNETDEVDEPTQTEEPDTSIETPSEQEPNENIDTSVEKNDRTISTIKISGGLSVGQRIQLTEETKIKILPSANSSNITKLSADTEVTVLEVINSWCRIETGEYVGWVRIDQ